MTNQANNNQKAAAADVFKGNETIDKVFVTSDCQCFEREESAIEHEKEVLGKYPNTDQQPVLVERAGAEDKKATAAELIEKIQAATSVEMVNDTVGDDTRKTVLEAAKAKLAELATANPPHAASEETQG